MFPNSVQKLQTTAHERDLNAKGERLIWVEAYIVDKLTAMLMPGESYSDVILRLVEIEARGAPAQPYVAVVRTRTCLEGEGEPVENPEIVSAAFWLGWLNLIKNVGAVLIVVGGAVALLADWFSAPLTKKVEDARTAELARLNNETARLSKEAESARASIADADARAAEANRSVALANTSNLATAEILALAMGMRSPEAIGEVAKPFLIILKIKPFAGKQFDAAVTSRDLNREALLNSLRTALKEAGWIEVGVREQSSADHASIRGIRIDVDGNKDPTLSDAASALASALNAEGVAATANQKPETDDANANVIHILVGPKAE